MFLNTGKAAFRDAGFRTRMAFEELLEHQLAVAVRERQALTLFLLRVDDFERYTATFDRAAGDALLKRVSNAVGSCFRRSSDVLARYEDDLLAVLTTSMDEAHMQAHGQSVCARVADLYRLLQLSSVKKKLL